MGRVGVFGYYGVCGLLGECFMISVEVGDIVDEGDSSVDSFVDDGSGCCGIGCGQNGCCDRFMFVQDVFRVFGDVLILECGGMEVVCRRDSSVINDGRVVGDSGNDGSEIRYFVRSYGYLSYRLKRLKIGD